MGFGTHFFDSGAFTLEKMARKFAKETGRSKWDFFRTKEAKQFLDDYAVFVKEHKAGLDYYANVDAIGNPELTWRNQQYLESLGLTPIPVVHYGSDMRWLRHYMDKGYSYIALGGLVGRRDPKSWIDACFSVVCAGDGLPKVRIHGFGITSLSMLRRYPWYSVDSTSWLKVSVYGNIIVPKWVNGHWRFDKAPLIISMSDQYTGKRAGDSFIETCSPMVRQVVFDWLDVVGVDWRCTTGEGGYRYRLVANMRYFQRLVKSLPEWPWPWRIRSIGIGV